MSRNSWHSGPFVCCLYVVCKRQTMLPSHSRFAPDSLLYCVWMPYVCTCTVHRQCRLYFYMCAFITGPFVHSGSIVADWEMFDISAILHFCVSNKKTFWCTMTSVHRDTHSGVLLTCEMEQPLAGQHLQNVSRQAASGPADRLVPSHSRSSRVPTNIGPTIKTYSVLHRIRDHWVRGIKLCGPCYRMDTPCPQWELVPLW